MMHDTLYFYYSGPSLKHYGRKNQKWGVRLYQNMDGSLTPAGKIRYGVGQARKRVLESVNEASANFASNIGKSAAEYAYDRTLSKFKPAPPKTAEDAYSQMYDRARAKSKLKYKAGMTAKNAVNKTLDYFSDYYQNVPTQRFDTSPAVSDRDRSLYENYRSSKASYEKDAKHDIRSYAFGRSDENRARAYDSADTIRQLYGNSEYYNKYERVANQVSVRKAMTKKLDEIKTSPTTQKIKDSMWKSIELMSMNIYEI